MEDPSGLARFVEENEWQGTRDPAAHLSVPSAIQFQAEHDWPQVRAECHEVLREARRRIEELTGLPPCDAGALQRRLYEEYRVEVPIIEWGGRQFVPVSVQGYNGQQAVATLVEALRDTLPAR